MSVCLRSSVSPSDVSLAATLLAQAGGGDASFGGGCVANHVATPSQYGLGRSRAPVVPVSATAACSGKGVAERAAHFASERTLALRVAASVAEVGAIESFRYEIYVAEMGKRLRQADHANRRLPDPDDVTGTLIYTSHGDRLVGTMRLHIGNAPEPLLRRLEAARVQSDPMRVGTVSKTMVAADRRGALAFAMMSQFAFRAFAEAGMTRVLLHCRPSLAPLYARLGFRLSGLEFVDDEVGQQVGMQIEVAASPPILRRGGSTRISTCSTGSGTGSCAGGAR